jgi:hypothetical protein
VHDGTPEIQVNVEEKEDIASVVQDVPESHQAGVIPIFGKTAPKRDDKNAGKKRRGGGVAFVSTKGASPVARAAPPVPSPIPQIMTPMVACALALVYDEKADGCRENGAEPGRGEQRKSRLRAKEQVKRALEELAHSSRARGAMMVVPTSMSMTFGLAERVRACGRSLGRAHSFDVRSVQSFE